jgi:hypothetical protein
MFDPAKIVILFEMTKQLLKIFVISLEMSNFAPDFYKIGISNEKIYYAFDVAGDPRPDSRGGVAVHES